MVNRRDVLAFGLSALGAGIATPRLAAAQSKYPDHPIKLVIPFSPGGGYDAIGRPWADRMKTLLGTVVVENIGGGGSSLGAAAVARAQPDGHTILLAGTGTLVVVPLGSSRPPYDPVKDFDPISLWVSNTYAIVVHPDVPAKNLSELIAYAKANPAKLSYGSAGVGSGNHLTGELFKSITGLSDIVHVPYKGGGPAASDLMGGQVQMATLAMTRQVLELHHGGKLRLLAVTSAKRLVAAPDIPTAAESLPKMVSENFIGLFAPRGTPKPIIEQIALATRQAIAAQDLQQLYIESGYEPYLNSNPAETAQLLKEELERWQPVIKGIGLSLN